MLRISCAPPSGDTNRVKVEGRIAGQYVAEVSRAVTSALDGDGRVVLDLSGVTYLDQAGAALLRGLRERGVDLVECSTFVETLVNGAAL